jgi:hypothetical protein
MPSCAPLGFIVPAVRPSAPTVQRPLVCAAPQSLACAVQRSYVVPSEDGQSWFAEHAFAEHAEDRLGHCSARGLRRLQRLPSKLPGVRRPVPASARATKALRLDPRVVPRMSADGPRSRCSSAHSPWAPGGPRCFRASCTCSSSQRSCFSLWCRRLGMTFHSRATVKPTSCIWHEPARRAVRRRVRFLGRAGGGSGEDFVGSDHRIPPKGLPKLGGAAAREASAGPSS